MTRLQEIDSDYKICIPVYKYIDTPPVVTSLPYKVLAYLDDTALMNSSTRELSRKLTTMSLFYDFINVQTNLKKMVMLMNNTEYINE